MKKIPKKSKCTLYKSWKTWINKLWIGRCSSQQA